MPSFFSRINNILHTRCPRCHQGALYSHSNPYNLKQIEKMPDNCPQCGQDFVIEPGFYFGATYISYALNVAWLVPLFLGMRFVLDLPYSWFVVTMFVLLPVFVPIFFRWSRAAWIHLFVKYDPVAAGETSQEEG